MCVTRYSAGTTSAQIVDTAFTPPISAMATPERAQPARRPRPRNAVTRGSTAHGTTRPGRAAADVDPITIVNVGHSANTVPASSREPSEPIRSVGASLASPQKPAATAARARAARSPRPAPAAAAQQEERGHRDRVADVLVLQRAEPLVRIPQRPQPSKNRPRDVHAELGVEDHPARVVRGEDAGPPARPAGTSASSRRATPAARPRCARAPAAAPGVRPVVSRPGGISGAPWASGRPGWPGRSLNLFNSHDCPRALGARSTDERGSLDAPQDHRDVPGGDLAEPGDPHDRLAPARVIAGQGVDDGDVAAGSHQPKNGTHVHREKGDAEPVLWRAAIPP